MKHYTSAQVAQQTGKAERTIRQLAEAHDEIGQRLGRWWVFTDADIAKIRAISKGRPRKRRAKAPAPAAAQPGPAGATAATAATATQGQGEP